MSPREKSHGFLPIEGTRVFVTGTKHHGFRGVVIAGPTPSEMEGSLRRLHVLLDEWDAPVVLYNHNVIPLRDEPPDIYHTAVR